jgi:hypothetical protein
MTKLFKILNLLLIIQLIFACNRSNKRSNDARKLNTTTNATTVKNKIVIKSDKYCNTSQNKPQEKYCLHNSTCLYHLVPLNETHDRQQIVCVCKPVS